MNYKWTICAISLFFIGILVLSGKNSGPEKLDTVPILTVGLNPDYPPFEYRQNSKLVGFDIELMQAIANVMGMRIQFQEMSFPNLMGALQTKKIDAAISSMTITPERQKHVDFSVPYYQSSLAVVYQKDHAPPSIGQLASSKIGVQLGSTMEKWIKENIQNLKSSHIFTLDTNNLLIEKLKLRQIDFLVIETLQAKEFTKFNPSLTYMILGKVEEGYGIALVKDSIHLKKINQAIQILKDNGTLSDLEKKWLGGN